MMLTTIQERSENTLRIPVKSNEKTVINGYISVKTMFQIIVFDLLFGSSFISFLALRKLQMPEYGYRVGSTY